MSNFIIHELRVKGIGKCETTIFNKKDIDCCSGCICWKWNTNHTGKYCSKNKRK